MSRHGFRPRMGDDGRLTAGQLVRRYIPGANDALVEHVMWGMTGWPGFWHIPRDGKTPLECFVTQVLAAAKELASGVLPLRAGERK